MKPECATCGSTLTISRFRSITDTTPEPRTLAVSELADLLSHSEERPSKGGALWSPAKYADGATRGNGGVLEIGAFVADIDDGWTVEEARAHLDALGVEYIIHTSHSSTPEHPKFRVVVPLTRAIPRDAWYAAFAALTELLTKEHTDPATKDPARSYYLPSHPPGVEPIFIHGHGRPFDPDTLPPPAPAAATGSRSLSPVRPAFEPTADVAALLVRVGGASADGPLFRRLLESTDGEARAHATNLALCYELHRAGATDAQIAALVDWPESEVASTRRRFETAGAYSYSLDTLRKEDPIVRDTERDLLAVAFEEYRLKVGKIVRTKDEIHGYSIMVWAAHTHLIPRFQSTFYLGFKGKTGAGKGTAVESCIALTPNGEVLGETTASYLASATDDGKAIGVEELDLLLERNPFIESLFRNGYRRGAYGGYKVQKEDGSKGWENARRSLFGPKVYDTHVGPSGHLLGRSVIIEMEPDDSVRRALDAEWKAEELAPVRVWLAGWAKIALEAWPPERFRAWWRSPEFHARVTRLGGRSGRDHVIGALMLATCDMMGWSLDKEIGTILAGRATIEEFGVEAEVLDALRELVPTPTKESEVLYGELLAKVNEIRKKTGVGRSLTQKSLAAPLRELGFKKEGDGTDPSDEWFKSNVGANRNKVVLRPLRVLASYLSGNQAHQAHQAHLCHRPHVDTDVPAPDALDATDFGGVGEAPASGPAEPGSWQEPPVRARRGGDP